MQFFSPSTFFYLLTFIVCAGYLVLLLFYLTGWKRTKIFQQASGKTCHTKVSVILPVRNEEKNIRTVLTCLSAQTYPKDLFEIIVVDDHSEDRTAELVRALAIPNLHYINLATGAGKKQAITAGIKKSSGTLIMTTDADCRMGEGWITSLVSYYESGKPKMLVGPVILQGEASFIEIIQGQEMTVLTASACASLYYNSPVLCSGANLAYEKEVFHAVNGFDGAEGTATGDDVFMMLKIQTAFPGMIKYVKSKEAVVRTTAESRPGPALSQRKRWASKTFSYGFSRVTGVAILVFLMNFFVFLSGILSVINVKFVFALVLALPLKCIADFMLLRSASDFLGKKVYVLPFLAASVLYPVYVSVIGLLSPVTGYSWKGRRS